KMYLYMFLLLLSCRASSYFIPLKETPFLQKIDKTTLIKEIICLLNSTNTSSNVNNFPLPPPQITDCAHNNTDEFIEELKNPNRSTCMIAVSKQMKKLENICSVLKEKTAHENNCKSEEVDFPTFKEQLKRFLEWVNEKLTCNSTVRNEVDMDVYNCSLNCWQRYHKRWL
uniref:Interleukin-7 n=1 Tax=Anas platyrhynchos platyrhynchos TaxID=8840 RepID=A0A493SXT7_ANAPP